MKKQGFTLIEMVVSLAILSIVIVFMMGTIVHLRNLETSTGIDTKVMVSQAMMTKQINSDVIKSEIKTISDTCSNSNAFYKCATITFADNSVKEIRLYDMRKNKSGSELGARTFFYGTDRNVELLRSLPDDYVFESLVVKSSGKFKMLKIKIKHRNNKELDSYVEMFSYPQREEELSSPLDCFKWNRSTNTIEAYYDNINGVSTNPACPKDVFIPNTIDEGNVLHIGDNAFKSKGLNSVNFPSALLSIGKDAFSVGNNLKRIDLPNSITSIGDYAFYGNQIETLKIPKFTQSIGRNAFSQNKIKTLELPTNLKTLGRQAFEYNEIGLVGIPKGLTNLEYGVFRNNKIKEITIPENIKKIEEQAFYSNDLRSITITENVDSIEINAFGKYISSNRYLDEIFNNNSREFNWGLIVNGVSGYVFNHGKIENTYGAVKVTNQEDNEDGEDTGEEDGEDLGEEPDEGEEG